MSETDLADVWARSLDGLADLQIKPHQRAWLKLTRPLGLVENTALIATPNEFVKEQLETRLRALVTHALSAELGRTIQLAVTVDPVSAAGPVPPDFTPADTGRHDLDRPPGGMAYGGPASRRPAPRHGRAAGAGRLTPPRPSRGPHDGIAPHAPLAADGTRLMPRPAPQAFPGTDYPARIPISPPRAPGPAPRAATAGPAPPARRPRPHGPNRTRRRLPTRRPGRAAPG